MSAHALPPGTAISDDYEVVRHRMDLTDPAGTEVLYEGRHLGTQRQVLLRLYSGVSDPDIDLDLKARFIQAARSASRLDHPGIVHVVDYGLGMEGMPFMVHEHYPGHTLEEELARQGRMPAGRAVDLICECLEALAAAHEAGMINRGLEPRNLLLTHPHEPEEMLRILNFGSIFLDDAAIERMTRTGDLVGAARYLSPEYIEHGEISARLDIYQMGLILIEMLAGEPAVQARDPMGCILAHTRGNLSAPNWLKASDLWPALECATARDWRQRFENALAMRQALLSVNTAEFQVNEANIPSQEMRSLLDGQYEVESALGEGGFAKVYRGRHARTHQPVAIKIMRRRPDPSLHESFKKRFEVEARASASISHPNIVSIYHYGVTNDVPYIVMEMLDGHDLEQELGQHGPMAPERLLPLFIEALDALGEAHRCKVVHKDLKPANLFLTHPCERWETIKILDFGIARMGEGEEARLTQTGRMLFTCNYVAPEYIEHQIAAPQTDVYQMALILAEMLTGRLVVDGEQIECIMAHMHGKFDIPETLKGGVLWPILERALSKDHKARHADGAAFAAALRQIDPSEVFPGKVVIDTPDDDEDDFSSEATVETNIGYIELMRTYRQMEHLHNHDPERIPELQQLVAYCLSHGAWRGSSPELKFIEEVVTAMGKQLETKPSLGDTARNRRLMAIIWNKRRRTLMS